MQSQKIIQRSYHNLVNGFYCFKVVYTHGLRIDASTHKGNLQIPTSNGVDNLHNIGYEISFTTYYCNICLVNKKFKYKN